MSNEFDKIISETGGGEKLVDVGLSEPRGCDILARRNIDALHERVKISAIEISNNMTKIGQLEQTVMELMTKMSLLEQQLASVGYANVSGEMVEDAVELPEHLRQ